MSEATRVRVSRSLIVLTILLGVLCASYSGSEWLRGNVKLMSVACLLLACAAGLVRSPKKPVTALLWVLASALCVAGLMTLLV